MKIRTLILASVFLLFPAQLWAACGMGVSIGGNQCRVCLTSASTSPLILPVDFTSSNSFIAIGANGVGANTASSNNGGGGGGAIAEIFNLTDAAGTSEAFQVGAGGSGTDTQFKNGSTLLAKAGVSATTGTGTAGGLASGSVGTIKFSGGTGGSGSNGGAGGGGGAAGLNGNGANGTSVSFSPSGGTGGQGDAGLGGIGGTGGTGSVNGTAAGDGAELGVCGGSGGGGGGNASNNTVGGAPGAYGAASGGGWFQQHAPVAGFGGEIIMTYVSSNSFTSPSTLGSGDF